MSEFLLPDVGEGLTEAEIVAWKVKVGDTVEINDVIVEIETAKSLVELPSPFEGTVLAYGPTVKTALKCAEAAESEGRSLEVIDLRTLSPLDMAPVYESVRRTGRCVVTHEAHVNLGMGAEVAARVTEECFYSLEAPVLRVGAFDMPYPPSRIEEEYLPDLDRVLDAVDRSFAY